ERDAFLYVSDFAELMEDEELIEFPEAGSGGRPEQRSDHQRRFDRRDDRSRPSIERSARYQGGRVGPPHHEEPAVTEPAPAETISAVVSIEDVVEQLAEIVDERVIPPPQRDEESEQGYAGEPPAEPGLEAVGEGEAVEEVETGIGEQPEPG